MMSLPQDEAGIKVHKKFVKDLRAAQEEIEKRNASPSRLRKGQGLPYTLMMPSKPGIQEFPFDRPPARCDLSVALLIPSCCSRASLLGRH